MESTTTPRSMPHPLSFLKNSPGWVAILCVALALVTASAKAEENYALVQFQNDVFLGGDGGGYTNGIFLSDVRVASPGESRIERPLFPQPIADWLGMPQPTLAAFTLGQILVTPQDISRRIPDPNDVPYIGALIVRSTQVGVHDDTADMAAINLGVIGPASKGERVQRLVHRLTGSTTPEGWDSQVRNRALVGIERYRAWRWSAGGTEAVKAGGDFIASAGGALGSFESSIGSSVMLRYGKGLERSFPTVARVAALGSDPFALGVGWFGYAGLSVDRIFTHVGIGSNAPEANTARLRNDRVVATMGFAYGWTRSSLSFSLQSANPLAVSSSHRQSYGSVTYVVQLP